MDGFDFRELDDFAKELLELAQNTMPKETKVFLRNQGGELLKEAKKSGKQNVKTKTGNYQKAFKKGKVYLYDENLSIRVYNNSPHAHLVEFGHIQTGHKPNKKESGFVTGKFVLKKAHDNFVNKFTDNIEKFLDTALDKGLS